MKKVCVDESKCIGCGACVAIAPENFDFNDEGYSIVINENPNEKVQDALEACPVFAISIEDSEIEVTNECHCENNCECDESCEYDESCECGDDCHCGDVCECNDEHCCCHGCHDEQDSEEDGLEEAA